MRKLFDTVLLLVFLCLMPSAAQAAVTWGASGGTGATTGTTSLSIPYPSGIVAGNLLVLVVGNKYPTAGPTTPAGWTLMAQATGGLGAQAADSGPVFMTTFVKVASGTEAGNLSLTVTGANSSMARIFRYAKTGASWDYAATTGADTVGNLTWSVTGAADPGLTAGDVLLMASALNCDRVNGWTESVAATGATFGTPVERNDTTTTSGNDQGLVVSEHPVASGTATAAPVYAMTGSGGAGATTVCPTGAAVFLRMRESITTITTGSDPSATTIAPGTGATDVNTFTLQTNFGTEAVSSVTVNLSTNIGVGTLAITDATNTVLGSTSTPVTGSNTISVTGMSASTTLTSFKLRVTPLSHAAMPAVPGAAYSITAPVTAWAGANAHTGTDTNANALTIDNLSPASATATSGSLGYLANSLNWTSSSSSDFNTTGGAVVYRWAATSAGGEVPAEGSSPAPGATNGTATVACLVSSGISQMVSVVDGSGGSGGCLTTALTAGQNYSYKVFQRDIYGNYDAGVLIGTFKPYGAVSAATSTVVASPTSVAADNYTAATITVTLKDSAGTAVPGKAVALAAGSGSSVITTLSGTSNANGVASFSVVNGTVEGPITYTATDTTDPVVITQTAQVSFVAPSLCFTDDFNRASLLSTGLWTRTRGATTAYDADIVNNRLRLTDASGNRATAVHLFRLFPGAGNKVTAQFDYYSYNGTGGDGLAFSLSDSSIAPVAGAFGGSLGYAQKNATACPPTGCPGFAGGWIGVGLDEYGNFSNPTEGRVDGPGFFPNAVAVRGSGSSFAGYNWHKTVTTSGMTTSSATPHRYRVIVDHSDGVHAWVSVERDTSGGTNYTTVVPAYDAKTYATQAAVPNYWYFSFSASSGASTNYHEIDNLNICTAAPMIVPVLNHVRVIHDGSALTCKAETITIKACANSDCSALYTGSVTVSLPTISGATWSASSPVTFTGGQTTLTLSKTTTGTVSLSGVAVTSPTITNSAGICYNGATAGDCSLAYSSNACAFDAVESTKDPATPIYTKIAGTQFSLDVLALSAGSINTLYAGSATATLVDQTGVAAGTCSSTTLTSCSVTPATSFTFSSGRRSVSFTCTDAAPDVRVRITSGATTACSSDNFAIRPASLTAGSSATNTANSGTPAIKAGSAFTLSATPMNNASTVAQTPGYRGKATINTSKVVAHDGAVQSGTLSVITPFLAATAATNGVSAGTVAYSEVGNFKVKAWGLYDDGSFASVDRAKATPECFSDGKLGTSVDPAAPNTVDGNGMFGCYFGGADSAYFGRFIPDHFALTAPVLTEACTVGGSPFTYLGQDGFTTVFTLTAQNTSNQTTSNYEGNGTTGWAKLPLTAWGLAPASASSPGFGFAVGSWSPSQPAGTPASTLMASVTVPSATNSSTWKNGTTTVTARHQIVRPTTVPAVATTATITALPVDSDGVTVASAAILGTSVQRYGKLGVDNAFGSERNNLPVKLTAWYYAGAPTGWVVNTADACTATLPLTQYNTTGTTADCYGTCASATSGAVGSVLLQRPSGNTGAGLAVAAAPTPTSAVSLSSGVGYVVLRAPVISGTPTAGALDFIFVAPSWLKTKSTAGYDADPVGRITFGVYGPTTNRTRFIYFRENY
ncbi:DUF6701 domain-containing protein [uncultured Propionivibrio sp.]|uniref:DUF6701 domain-containing protein n=1 Tax=uncultured Propionivibrio sp. TaxID=426737 RepID=UPI0029C0E944|nr:DUF6701 domain-containing protein [uncultured Propionivibrio sp.]